MLFQFIFFTHWCNIIACFFVIVYDPVLCTFKHLINEPTSLHFIMFFKKVMNNFGSVSCMCMHFSTAHYSVKCSFMPCTLSAPPQCILHFTPFMPRSTSTKDSSLGYYYHYNIEKLQYVLILLYSLHHVSEEH